jgi:hypothetical protein
MEQAARFKKQAEERAEIAGTSTSGGTMSNKPKPASEGFDGTGQKNSSVDTEGSPNKKKKLVSGVGSSTEKAPGLTGAARVVAMITNGLMVENYRYTPPSKLLDQPKR